MFRRTRNAWFAALLVALVVGWFLAGSLLYRSFIGLDASAWIAGRGIQRLVVASAPELKNAVGGVV